MTEPFKPKKLSPGAIKRKTPDELGRMPFGKYEFERFENVPKEYMLYLKYGENNMGESSSLNKYPNLKKFIEGLTEDD